jgi:hypothetical protein
MQTKYFWVAKPRTSCWVWQNKIDFENYYVRFCAERETERETEGQTELFLRVCLKKTKLDDE